MPSTSDPASGASGAADTPVASHVSVASGASATGCRAARRVSVDPSGPVLVEGPVEILLDDGTLARSDRFTVAVCTCRRSRTYPWCDTSHRPRERAATPGDGHAEGSPR